MASPEDATSPSTTTDDDNDMNMRPLAMDNSLMGKLNEGRYYINKAGEEFQKCVGRLEESQIESIRQTHIRLDADCGVRLTDQLREVKSTQGFPRCENPKNIHKAGPLLSSALSYPTRFSSKAHRFADEARHFHKHIVIMSRGMQSNPQSSGQVTSSEVDVRNALPKPTRISQCAAAGHDLGTLSDIGVADDGSTLLESFALREDLVYRWPGARQPYCTTGEEPPYLPPVIGPEGPETVAPPNMPFCRVPGFIVLG
ncbi:hypothetical protein DFH07DRAFT_764559 [Mycena maculata]|uniref:Uncharacterized protein n=1 Tax=Mycena maculata TaxID=230809 RepID=A0AAD7KBR0_9AGAR|nr:hypothetical protein DFH07DRAFT_764559 [Mycena maculata]